MKFLHLADLHLGKKINEYSLFDDQRYVLDQAFSLAKSEKVDAIVIAGDVYDSSAPSAETMAFYDEFLAKLHSLRIPVLMISGNHDSPERLAVASSILKEADIHIVTRVEDSIHPIVVGGVAFYLLPYCRPSDVNRAFDTTIKTYEEGMKEVLSRMEEFQGTRILVTHQAILPVGTKVASSGSETSLEVDSHGDVAGSEIIDANLFGSFAYLALGHIHKAQNVTANARYPGALLKYHVNEANAKRSFTIVSIEGGKASVQTYPIQLKRDLAVLKGTLDEIMAITGHENDFVQCVLSEEIAVDSPYAKLKVKYPYCLGIDYAHNHHADAKEEVIEDVEELSKPDLFNRFFEQCSGRPLDEQENAFVKDMFDQLEAKQ